MVALPHSEKTQCDCPRCKPRFFIQYPSVVNDQPCVVQAEISIKGADLIADLLHVAIKAAPNAGANDPILAQLKGLEAIFRRQLPTGQTGQSVPSSAGASE